MHKQNARSRLFSEYVGSRLLTPSLRGYPPRARAGRNRVCGMRIHRDPQRVTHAHCIGTRKATINAQHSVVPTLGHRTHQTLWVKSVHCMHTVYNSRGNRSATVVMLQEIIPLSFGQPNTTEGLARALCNCVVSVPSRSRSYGLHVGHATAVAACTCRTHETN